MSSTPSQGDPVDFNAACEHDANEIAALARARMPRMTYLHDLDAWSKYYRFGCGQYPLDNYLITGRSRGSRELVSFIWADAAMWTDNGIEEPWWCINALCVAEDVAGKGLGADMVRHLKLVAADAGVASLYGVCYPESAGFWAKQGFNVGEPGAPLKSDKPSRRRSGEPVTVSFADEEGDHMFVWSRPVDSARLVLPSS